MRLAALERLVVEARTLPGEKADAGLPRAVPPSDEPVEPVEPEALRVQVGALLRRLATRLEDELPRALRLADSAWDQVDSVVIVDPPLAAELDRLRRASRVLASDGDPGRRANGVAAELTLDSAAGLVGFLERRLATLVRLRLQAPDPALVDRRGRPFLDAAAALSEVARQWS
jgi:hypothetical protein